MSASTASVLAAQLNTRTAERGSMGRWFFAAMAVLFFLTVLFGFVPTSIEKVHAVAAGQRPPLPLALHAHAVVMGSWISLLLVQTFLAGSGRTALHRRLGVVSFVLVPLILVVMVLVARASWATVAGIPAGAMPLDVLGQTKALLSNILLEQMKALVLFPLFAGWAIAVRRTDPETHKRMMIVATLTILPAAIDRLAQRWLPTTFPAGYEVEYGYMLLWLASALIYDLLRLGRIHRAYLIAIACNVPFFILNHYLWGTPRWLETAPAIMRATGVSTW